jgi:hypothetical protein
MQDFLNKYKKGNVAVTLAYSPSPKMTFIDMEIPHVVPLYADFNVSKTMGAVRLVSNKDGIYAMFELTPAVRMRFRDTISRGEIPNVVLALSGEERIVKDGVNFVRGGTITAASLHDRGFQETEEATDEPA